MCSLQESLPPPALGIVTVAEQNGDLIARPEDEATTLIGNSLQVIIINLYIFLLYMVTFVLSIMKVSLVGYIELSLSKLNSKAL